MDSIYFEDPLGLLIELASYRFEPPAGYTHADVLLEAHKLRVEREDYNIARSTWRTRSSSSPSDRGSRSRRTGRRRIPTRRKTEEKWPQHPQHLEAERQQPVRAGLDASRRTRFR